MLDLEPNTLAFMTAALEQSCKRLTNDTPEGRKFVADRLKQCARSGRVSMVALTEAGEEAVAALNGVPNSSGGEPKSSGGWRGLLGLFRPGAG